MRDRSLLAPARVYRAPSFQNSKIYTFERSLAPTVISSSTVTPNFQSYSFQLNDFPNFGEFTSLFDQYRLERVLIRIIPHSTIGSTADPVDGYLAVVVDYDDATNPSSIDAMMEYQNSTIVPATQEFQTSIVPRAAVAAYSGAFTSYANVGRQWCDVASPAIQHYGFKIGIAQTSSVRKWSVYRKYTLAFRSPR